jgi:hypothetical protein
LEYPAWPPARCWLDPALLAAAAIAGALLWGGKDFSISLCHLVLACTLFFIHYYFFFVCVRTNIHPVKLLSIGRLLMLPN